jgi:hypothetical protein
MTKSAVANFLVHRLSVRRCAATGTIVLGVLFVLCWLGGTMGLLGVSHMFVALFTTSPTTSAVAIASGLLWSLVFGALTGALTALAYNAFPALGR